jgi:hypothetical protein
MKILVSLLLISLTLFGNIFEDFNIYNAQKEYEKQNYEKAFAHLSNIKKKDSKVHYNLGNTLYKMGKYEDNIPKKPADNETIKALLEKIKKEAEGDK